MCVNHLAPVTSVLVLRNSSPSTEGCRYIASLDSSRAAYGLLSRCIITAADHVHDLVVDNVLLCPVQMVFVKLFEFYVVYPEHRRRYPMDHLAMCPDHPYLP